RTAAAKSEVPRKTVLKISAARLGSGLARFPRLAHGSHGLLARLSRDPIEDQDAVEVVDLVLDHARAQTLGLYLELVARAVARARRVAPRARLRVELLDGGRALLELNLDVGVLEWGLFGLLHGVLVGHGLSLCAAARPASR